MVCIGAQTIQASLDQLTWVRYELPITLLGIYEAFWSKNALYSKYDVKYMTSEVKQ
jgi:hypothetical protein